MPTVRQNIHYSNCKFVNEEPRIISVEGPFCVSPRSYEGLLWALATTGNILSISPFSLAPNVFTSLGQEFGRCPFVVTEIIAGRNNSDKVPYLLALSSTAIRGVNLLNKQTTEFCRTSAPEQYLCSIEDGFVGIEADERYAYFLKSGQIQTSLQVCSFTDGNTRDYEVSAPVVAGPFKVGNRVGVYSCDSIYLLRDTALEPFPFPQNFRAWTSASEIHDLQPPFGKLPFLQHGNSLYIPGIVSGVSGFLVVSMQERAPTFVPLPIKGRVSYTQDSDGRLVLSKDGEVVVYEGSSTVVRKEDRELSGVGAALYDDPLMIGRAKSSGGRESLRFFLNGTQEDFALARLSGFVETIGLYCLAGSLVVTCLSGQESFLIVVWDCA